VNFLKFVKKEPKNFKTKAWRAPPSPSLPHFAHEVDTNKLIKVHGMTDKDVGFYLFSLDVKYQGYPATSSAAIQL